MKTYILDTNILLDSASNIRTLSENGANIIVIPEIVLDELDCKKTGFDDINFNAREFARLLEDSYIAKKERKVDLNIVHLFVPKLGSVIQVISKESYDCDKNPHQSIQNDRKILELALAYKNFIKETATLISLDVMCRIRASSLGIPSTTLHKNAVLPTSLDKELTVSNLDSLDNARIFDVDPDYNGSTFSYTLTDAVTGKAVLANVYNSRLNFIKEAELEKQDVKPVNKNQKFLVDAILSDFTRVVSSDALAGSGKTLLSLSTAMRLVKEKKYEGIIYVRNSIESLAKGEDVGYLPGLDEKFRIYNHPLYDSLYFIARSRLTRSRAGTMKANAQNINDDLISEAVDKLVETYNIKTMWVGEMRGRTISNSIVIVDEFQNCSASTGQLILSRLDKGCKAICIGSNRQIDNAYTNKHVNALTRLLVASQVPQKVPMFSCSLPTIVRGDIAALAEEIFQQGHK